MIFSKTNHIEQIKAEDKTQTRRPSNRYSIDRSYAIQPGRTKPGILEGRIHITHKWVETRTGLCKPPIPRQVAQAEGGYTPLEYRQLYEEMYPDWTHRWAYVFEYKPTEEATA